MVHLAVLVIASIFAIGCSKNNNDIPEEPQPNLPLDPNQADKSGTPMAKPDAPEAKAGLGEAEKIEDVYIPLMDVSKSLEKLTPAQADWQRMFSLCYDSSDLPKKDDNGVSFDKAFVKCLRDTFGKYPEAYSKQDIGLHFFFFQDLAWNNVQDYKHFNAQEAFDISKVYGEAYGVKGSVIKTIEGELKKAQGENHRLQEKYCQGDDKVAPDGPPPPENLVCPPFKVNTLEVVPIEGRVPKDSKATGTDLLQPYKGGPNLPGTDLARPKKSKKSPKPGSLEDRITNPYQ